MKRPATKTSMKATTGKKRSREDEDDEGDEVAPLKKSMKKISMKAEKEDVDEKPVMKAKKTEEPKTKNKNDERENEGAGKSGNEEGKEKG